MKKLSYAFRIDFLGISYAGLVFLLGLFRVLFGFRIRVDQKNLISTAAVQHVFETLKKTNF